MNNADFAGNKRVISQLGGLIDSKRFPHAVIIEGEQGLGKKTLARLLAAALVCRSENKPCMECTQCRKAVQGIHPDIFEHSAAGGANSFHIDVVRQVISDVYVKPNEGEHKVYILGNAHCMSIPAQNALLKVLEEPPEYAVFILTAVSKSMMLETVLSRSVAVTLEGVEINEGVDYILFHFSDLADRKSVADALKTYGGNIGKALESLTDGRAGELAQVCGDICTAVAKGSEYELLKLCAFFQKDRQSVVQGAELMKNIFRDALVYKPGRDMLSGQSDTALLLKNTLTSKKLIDLMGVCDTLKEAAQMNSNNSLLITKICYSLMEAAGR